MRFLSLTLAIMAAILAGACDRWPTELGPLAESISREVSGEANAWLVGGDVLVIDVANSPRYRAARSDLENLASGIAAQAIAYSASPLESVVITFHEGEVSDDREKMHEFLFLVLENRPVLQPNLDPGASGPLTADEIQAALDNVDDAHDRLGKPMTGAYRACLRAEVEKRAKAAGDPETLDPASVEFLTAETWRPLDAFSRRLVLTQAIVSKALFTCAGEGHRSHGIGPG